MRNLNRPSDALRPVTLDVNVNKYAEGSCFIQCGQTKVMCTASLEEKVPHWIKGTGLGWVTAEYGMLPRATSVRMDREAKKGQTGRTHEIQRLVGRALRGAIDLKAMGETSIKVDCDVIQADGGTRTASVTGGFVALYLALQKMVNEGVISSMPVKDTVSAVSCGICQGEALLDLDYAEDSSAQTDSNFVILGNGQLIEVQGTAERNPFSQEELLKLLALAVKGTDALKALQRKVLGI